MALSAQLTRSDAAAAAAREADLASEEAGGARRPL